MVDAPREANLESVIETIMAPLIVTRLSVNLNKVALLRNQRDLDLPSVEAAARTVLEAGASGITMHPRPDGRHALPSDVVMLRGLVEEYSAELNVEGNPTEDFLRLITDVRPHQVTLVPDVPDARTSDHGWDIEHKSEFLSQIVPILHSQGCRVSLFVDHDAEMALAAELGVDGVELYTEPYARAFLAAEQQQILLEYARAAKLARNCGLHVHAGHDLSLQNLGVFLEAVSPVSEVSIGHALTAEALWLGLDEITRRYVQLINDLHAALHDDPFDD